MRAIAVLLCLALAGCAAPESRYFSAEQDAEMREHCAPAGCVVIPLPVWQEIERMLVGGEST